MDTGYSRGRRAIVAVMIVVIGSFTLVSMYKAQGHSVSTTWRPTSAQTSLAQRVALTEANSLNPDPSAITTTDRWPTNVTSVRFAESTRNSVVTSTGAFGPPDDRNVLVIRMTGMFRYTAISVPPGVDPVMTRHVITLVVDATTGNVIDFAAADSAPELANSVPLGL